MQSSKVFDAKKLKIFQKLWCVRTDKEGGGWGSAKRGRGINFWRFCSDVFYGRPL